MKRLALVASDLDGTLLDSDSYDLEPARPALDALLRAGVPLALCSSKTRAELEALADRVGLPGPLVVENGGAIVWRDARPGPARGGLPAGPELIVLGVARERLLALLPEIGREAGVRLRSFAEMSRDELAARTGLAPGQAQLAQQREYDEPFVVLDPGAGDRELTARLDAAARTRGLRVTRGGRFRHLCGPADKGDALRLIIGRLGASGRGEVVALGDAPNDLPLLRAASRPVVMPMRDGSLDPELARALPGAERAPAAGPAGWSAAVLAILAGRSLPRLAA